MRDLAFCLRGFGLDTICRNAKTGAVPTKSAICAGAAVAPKAMIGLGTGDPGIDWEFRHGVKGGMRQLASLECQSQENCSSLRILDLECASHKIQVAPEQGTTLFSQTCQPVTKDTSDMHGCLAAPASRLTEGKPSRQRVTAQQHYLSRQRQ